MTGYLQLWREQLDALASLPPMWFDNGQDRWGLPLDEGAIITTRRMVTTLGTLVDRHYCSIYGEPDDGSVHLQWWRTGGDSLSVYIEPYVVSMILAYDHGRPGWSINRESVPFGEAVALIGAWLGADTTQPDARVNRDIAADPATGAALDDIIAAAARRLGRGED